MRVDSVFCDRALKISQEPVLSIPQYKSYPSTKASPVVLRAVLQSWIPADAAAGASAADAGLDGVLRDEDGDRLQGPPLHLPGLPALQARRRPQTPQPERGEARPSSAVSTSGCGLATTRTDTLFRGTEGQSTTDLSHCSVGSVSGEGVRCSVPVLIESSAAKVGSSST